MKKVTQIVLPVGMFFALFVAFFVSTASVAHAKEAKMKSTTLKGWVSDSKCGLKGASAAHASCAAKCIANGEKPVLVEGDKIMTIDNPDAVKGHEGHYVKVKGHVEGDSVHVMEVAMLKQPKEKAKTDSMSEMHK